MPGAIKVVSEQEIGAGPAQGTALGGVSPLNGATPPQPAAIHPQVLAALGEAGNRLTALEQVAQNLPRAAHHVAMLLRALGAKVLAFIGLVGCLGLAAELGPNPTWQGLAILGIVVVGVQLPLVASAYWGRT